jgi:hypothetical protein
MKTCTICYERKPVSEFYKSKVHADGLFPWCKKCKRAHDAEYARRPEVQKKMMLTGARGNAKRKGQEFSITEEHLDIPEKCPILGIPLQPRGSDRDSVATIDRIDNTKGYIPGNVVVISGRANRLKSDSTIEEMETILRWRKEHSRI